MIVLKVMSKLKFSYFLKHEFFVCDSSLFFPFDFSNLMWLAL
jgi:hypothetical protein